MRSNAARGGYQTLFKAGLPRPIEVLLALVGLTISAPAVALSALFIAISSRGPVIYRQERMGLGGRTFVMYKLRTMRASSAGPQVTARGDDRVTRVGKLLRAAKLDEFPELWNVVKGDMSLVGPRPEVPRYVDLSNPSWQSVLSVRPGITDPTTVRLRSEEVLLALVDSDRENFYLQTLQPYKLEGYLRYLESRSALMDLRILAKTALAVIFPSRTAAPATAEILKSAGNEVAGDGNTTRLVGPRD